MPIDLHKHAVVEASAGTGKTYAIEQTVLQLLLERGVGLEQILLVTFTEKATGELKGRLRTALASKLREQRQSSLRPHLQAALDSFDQACIFTIHGFCQRLLAEYAVEQGQDLRREHVDDGDLIEPALREVQRRIWSQEFGPHLQQVLELAGYNRNSARQWEKKVRELALKFRPELDLLRPGSGPDDMVLDVRVEQCRALLARLRAFTGPIPEHPLTHGWYENFLYIDMNHKTRTKKLDKFLEPLLRLLSAGQTDVEPLRSFCQFHENIEGFSKSFAALGYLVFFEHISDDSRAELAAKCPGLTEAIAALDAFRHDGGFRPFADQLAVTTVRALRQCISDIKTERGLYSFDDLIADVDQALDPANRGSRTLLDTLRRRFRYAVVDEFQDTDPLQWRILRRLFLDGGESRLMVVGDPKQAIFSFRGADLPTYLEAASAMKGTFGAEVHRLQTNWRTVPQLLQPLNRLFERGDWFAASADIVYRPVEPAPEPLGPTIEKDPSGRAPLTIVNLQATEQLKKARKQFARFAAGEIRRLLDAGIEFLHKEKLRKLDAGDICLLVFKRADAEPLMAALRQAGLPYTFHKQSGLWSSPEAEHLGIILRALAAPDDRAAFRKALLTSFFRLDVSQLALCDEVPPRHAARTLFDKWLAFADKRHWSALAQSLLEETGVLFVDLAGSDVDRRAGNLRYLLDALQEAAYRDNLDLFDLVTFFENRRQNGADLQADFQPIETDRPKVKIMTIHASKGLEHPVVFLAGGFTKGSRTDLAMYRDGGRRVFDLDPDAKGKAAHKDEESAEYRRLLYVALTRAMLKLYVPLVGSAQSKMGYAGPVATLLAPALESAQPAQLGFQHAALVEAVFDKGPGPSPQAGTEESSDRRRAGVPAVPLQGDLFPALDDNLGRRRLVVRSFSSLQRAQTQFHFSEEVARAEDEGPEQLPEDPFRGPVFGEIVHEVLETIDFAAVRDAADVSALVEKGSRCRTALDGPITKRISQMRGRDPLEQRQHACTQRVAELVWNALRSPLPGLGGRLCDIPAGDRIPELEFLFPQNFGETAPAEVRLEEGFFTGFMDLVFRKDGLYYLLDWKTNMLDSYDEAAILRAMEQSGYHRQYRLYLCALARWLARRHGQGFNFLEHCGGVYYLFLRGMSGASAGVFSHRPTASDLTLATVLGEA